MGFRTIAPLVLGTWVAMTACGTQNPSFVEETAARPVEGVADATRSPSAEPREEVPIERPLEKSEEETNPVEDPQIDDPGSTDPSVLKAGTPDADPFTAELVSSLEGKSILKSFPSSESKAGELGLNLVEQLAETRIVLNRLYSEESLAFQQMNRPRLLDSFTQGNAGAQASDSFQQMATPSGVLDILIVVDNSGSMSQEQANLSTKLGPLLSYVQNSDWRIAVTTTDPGWGCVTAVINKGDADAEANYSAAVQPGIHGSGLERGILQAVNGLEATCLAQPWLRANSTVAVLIVSDENNCSSGSSCGNDPWNNESYLLDYLAGIRVPGVNAKVYGLFRHPNEPCATAPYNATQYAAAVDATGGTWGSICDTDYTNTLQAISGNIAAILENQFALSHTPDPGSIAVSVDGLPVYTGWSVSGNVITFTTAPVAGSQIDVTYSYGAQPIHTQWALSQAADASGMNVSINGVPTTAFIFEESSNSVVFPTPPADGATVQVDFLPDTPLPDTFSIGENVLTQSLYVSISGVQTTDFQHLEDTIRFTSPPPDGVPIGIDLVRSGDPVLTYAYAVEISGNEVVLDVETGATLTATFEEGQVTISSGDFEEGRLVAIRRELENEPDRFQIDLPHTPIVESVTLAVGQSICNAPAEIGVEGQQIDISACDLGTEETALATYQYIAARHKSFEIDKAFFEDPHAIQIWDVHVDGVQRTDYTVEGNRISFASDLPIDIEVKIAVSLIREKF